VRQPRIVSRCAQGVGDFGQFAQQSGIADFFPPKKVEAGQGHLNLAFSAERRRRGCSRCGAGVGRTEPAPADAIRAGTPNATRVLRVLRLDRVFVVLSDKYLKSPYCMFELLEVWRFSRGEKAEFIDRVRAYTLPGVQISTLLDRLQYAVYWTKRRDTVDSLVKQHGIRILGEDGMKEYFLMEDFVGRVSDILAMVADRLQPGNFEELEKHWLNDLQE
jgi:hypothetical protein